MELELPARLLAAQGPVQCALQHNAIPMARTLRATPSALRITIRLLSGAMRRPSSGCSRLLLIRSAVRQHY